MRRAPALVAAGLGVLLLLAGCRAGGTPSGPVASPANPVLETVELTVGGRRVLAEVADEHDERVLGLMNRTELGRDAGMLFVFPGPTSGGFWMKNTLIPLQIAYLRRTAPDRFEVLSVVDMEPCTSDPCPTYPSGRPYDAALEMAAGWFDDAGAGVGDAVVADRGVETTS